MARMTSGPILALWIATGAGIGTAMGVATDNIGTWEARPDHTAPDSPPILPQPD